MVDHVIGLPRVAGGFVGVAGDDREMFGDGGADALFAGEVVDPEDSDSVGEVAKDGGGDECTRDQALSTALYTTR